MTLTHTDSLQALNVELGFGSRMIKIFAALGRSGGRLSEPVTLHTLDGDFLLTEINNLAPFVNNGTMIIFGKGTLAHRAGPERKVRVDLELRGLTREGIITFIS